MKKLFKPLIGVIAIGAITLSINNDKNVIANDIADKCDYDAALKVNPDYSTMNCLLTKTALEFDVPPEIVKAVAEGESGNWRHFDNNGKAIVTADNGIGLMQITNQAGYNEERLKSDLVYNIESGVKILDKMFDRSDLPKINNGDREVLESWYFAIMAYNGTKPVNSPIVQATGERNVKAYQEKILGFIKTFEKIDLQELPFKSEEFQYDSNSRDNIKFLELDYNFDLPLTKSKYSFEKGQKVNATTNVTVRSRPTTDSDSKGTLSKGETVTISGPFKYEEVETKKNHFVWYPVKRSDGSEGYVASSYLEYADSISTPGPTPLPKPTPPPPVIIKPDYSEYFKKFADFRDLWWAESMVWAIDKGYIQGDSTIRNEKTNKLETYLLPNKQLTEAHFLTIFFRYAENDALANAKSTSSWGKSKVYNLAKKYNMPVRASEKTKASRALAEEGIRRGKLAQLMVSYYYGKAVSEDTAIQFFIKNGLTTQPSIKEFKANDILTRAHISAFIQRYESFVSKQK
ncbi:MAG: SH3 domain-containing protein [Solibacillus sp.]